MGLLDLGQQGSPHVAHAGTKQVHAAHLTLKQRAVQRPKRLGHVVLLNDDADVSLCRALGNGKDVDAVFSQGVKGTTRKARVVVHGVPHQGEDAEP